MILAKLPGGRSVKIGTCRSTVAREATTMDRIMALNELRKARSYALLSSTGPIYGFSNTWQLVINTGTTIVTFLMVFLIQNSQNRESKLVACDGAC